MLLLFLPLGTLRPDRGQVPLSTLFIENRYPELPARAVVLSLAGQPLSYAVVRLPPGIPLLGLGNNGVFSLECRPWQQRAMRQIKESGTVCSIHSEAEPNQESQQNAARYGLRIGRRCERVPSTLADVWLCPVRRIGHSTCE